MTDTLPFAVFDEFGVPADDRVQDYTSAVAETIVHLERRAEAAEARIAELAGKAANRLEAAESALQDVAAERDAVKIENAKLCATLAASCDDEREMKWEATTGGGCSRAIAAEAERDALRRALNHIEAKAHAYGGPLAAWITDTARVALAALASASPPTYHLSVDEQAALNRAMLRSVTIKPDADSGSGEPT